MTDANRLLRTREKDARTLPPDARRGVRYWSVAEVPGDVWYMVEATELTPSDETVLRRFVTTEIHEALNLMRGPHDSPALHAYIRDSAAFFTGSLFQRVEEVYEIDGADGEILLQFASGLMLTLRGNSVVRGRAVGVCQRIFPWKARQR